MMRPKSARLPVTKQILRLGLLIAGPDAGAGGEVDQAALDRFGSAEIAAGTLREHRQLVHQRPGRTCAKTGVVERGEDLVAPLRMGLVEQDCVQPVIARGVLWLAREADSGSIREGAFIGQGKLALARQKTVELLELGAAERGIQIGQAVIEADLVMHECPF